MWRRVLRRYGGMTSGALVLLATGLVLNWSVGPALRAAESTPPPSPLGYGYALLHDLLSQQKNVDKILLLKNESDALDELLTDIAEASGDGAAQIKEMADTNNMISLGVIGLPMIERRVRKAMSDDTASKLLAAGGREFELRMLLAQFRATGYVAELARQIAELENDGGRAEWLRSYADRYKKLRDRTFDLLRDMRQSD